MIPIYAYDVCHLTNSTVLRNSKIPKGKTEIVNPEDRQYHGQQNETKDKHNTYKHNTTLKTKAGVTSPYKNQGDFRCSGRVSNYWSISFRRI